MTSQVNIQNSTNFPLTSGGKFFTIITGLPVLAVSQGCQSLSALCGYRFVRPRCRVAAVKSNPLFANRFVYQLSLTQGMSPVYKSFTNIYWNSCYLYNCQDTVLIETLEFFVVNVFLKDKINTMLSGALQSNNAAYEDI